MPPLKKKAARKTPSVPAPPNEVVVASPQVAEGAADSFLPTLQRESVQFLFMDPPFNIDEPYEGYRDKLSITEYRAFLSLVLCKAVPLIAKGGSLVVHLPDEWAWYAHYYLNDHSKLTFQRTLVWHYRFGQYSPGMPVRSKCFAVWFSNGDPYVDTSAIEMPSDRAAIYNDARTKEAGGTRPDFDVWGFDPYWGRVQGNNKERVPSRPNQLPEVYLIRLIKMLTREGDLVVDPFLGTGTTAVAAAHLRRNFTGCDKDPAAVLATKERLKRGLIRKDT